jgi:ferredoxin
MIEEIKQWLEDGIIDLFLGYKMVMGHPLPHCFTRDKIEEVDDLIIGSSRYSLEKIATHITAVRPDIKIGMLARDCNQRALNVLSIWNQLNPENVKTVNVNCCPSNLREHGDCSYLEPETPGICKQQVGVDNTHRPQDIEAYDQQERLARWMYEFQKCIKCYGCRNICPVCFCQECSLEHKELVGTGTLPPEVPVFHLVRAVHMAGRCIDCGLCEDACPVDIPLRLLYRKVNEIIVNVFDYETGSSAELSPFSILGDKVTLVPKPLHIRREEATSGRITSQEKN